MWVNSGKYKVKRKFGEDIETEEILMDSKRLKESPDSDREKIETPIKERVIKLFLGIVAIVLLILFAQSLQLQIIKGSYWRNMAEGNRIRSYPIKALRGIIYDQNKIPLAINLAKLDLTVVPVDLVKRGNFEEILEKISQFTEKTKDEIDKKIQDNKSLSYPIIIEEDLSKEKAVLIEAEFADIPEIKIQKNSYRYYENAPAFAHVLGYLGKVNPEEVSQKKYYLDDYIGRTGIEEMYEDTLKGVSGEELTEIDNLGRAQKILATKEPINGNDIVLSIDAELQKKVYQSIKDKLSGLAVSRAAAVAMNPQNGKILALVSFPGFDSNNFIKGSSDFVSKILQDKNQPLFNRAISGGYPSGSTIKPMIAAAALEENVINPNKVINCTGQIDLIDKYNKTIYWTFHDWKTHGPVDMIKAIAESCDVYFYTLGGGYGNIEGLGIDRIKKYLQLFGWGEKTGIDLPEEKAGFVPDAEWKKQTKDQDWFIGDTYNTSIGQGDILISPLQLTSAIAAIANGGKLFQPQMIQDAQPKIIRDNFIQKDYLEIVRRGMRETVVSGTAMSLNDLPIPVAGKTGTAELFKGRSPHAWFTAFAPYENPQIVITVLIENGGEIGGVSTSIAKDILSWYFQNEVLTPQ